jgi:hypothetical protein
MKYFSSLGAVSGCCQGLLWQQILAPVTTFKAALVYQLWLWPSGLGSIKIFPRIRPQVGSGGRKPTLNSQGYTEREGVRARGVNEAHGYRGAGLLS